MGGTSYSANSRSIRATTRGYATLDASNMDSVFKQVKERKAHDSMKSQGIELREARDSDVHPETVPIIIALDVTGSMGHIPRMLIKDGLPKIVGGLIQNGITSPAVLFLAVGDHECDREPLQVGQFESGDEELDMWLTRTYPEGGGGGNSGESYSLAHYFAARHCVTDAWEKRGQKGFLFTIGDEPNLKNYPNAAMREVMGNGDISTFTDTEILEEVKEKWNVYHIDPHGRYGRDYWKQLLKGNYVELTDHEMVPETIKNIVCSELGDTSSANLPEKNEGETPNSSEEKDDSFIR